jgi:hypothetical protein
MGPYVIGVCACTIRVQVYAKGSNLLIPRHGAPKISPPAYNKRRILRQSLSDPFVSLTRDTGYGDTLVQVEPVDLREHVIDYAKPCQYEYKILELEETELVA